MKHKEGLISAYHNYLVNNMLSPGFVLGSHDSHEDLCFLADLVLPGESPPNISAHMFDSNGRFLIEIKLNRVNENPGRCPYKETPGGFRVLYPSGELLLDVYTQSFANGYLTRIQGKFYDRTGRLRMEPSYEGVKVYGESYLVLDR